MSPDGSVLYSVGQDGSLYSVYSSQPDLIGSLKDMYSSLGGDMWRNNTGWKAASSHPCDGWYGITCDDSHAITAISLFGNGLVGTLRSPLTGLSSIVSLGLNGNAITGAVPSSLCQLTSLT